MQTVLNIVQKINLTLSDYVLIVLLIGTGLFFSIKTRFVQVRCFGEGMRSVFGKISPATAGGRRADSSSFQALATAVAAQVGTGNIIGATGAILTGGPGAIFWMWIIAFFGMATIYAEAVLAQETRDRRSRRLQSAAAPSTTSTRRSPTASASSSRASSPWPLLLALGFHGQHGAGKLHRRDGLRRDSACPRGSSVMAVTVVAGSHLPRRHSAHRVRHRKDRSRSWRFCTFVGGLVASCHARPLSFPRRSA